MSNRSPLPFVFRKYPNIHFIRPIYDWETSDLFKFFQQAGLPYAPIYNAQMWHGLELRVATVLHDRAYSNLAKLREMYPAFYERVLAIWPDVATHERYWKDVDRLSVIDRYPPGWQGIVQYIGEHIDEPANRAKALAAVKSARAGRERNMQRGRLIKSYGGFPIRYVFAQVVSGGYMKGIHDTLNASDADIAYENRVLATRKLPSPKEPTDG